LLSIWAFALLDIFPRDDLGGVWKALWVAVAWGAQTRSRA
jgi:hypothetical protein